MKKIISVLLAVIAITFVFTACSSKEYKDTVVTQAVTNENGETVTDENGKTVTEVVSDTSSSSSEKSTDASSAATEKTTSKETTKKSDKKTTTTKKSDKTTTTKKDETTTTTKPTTVAANRELQIEVFLPYGNTNDKIIISVDGKEVKTDKVVLNGSTFTYTTKDKYKGDVTVDVKFEKNTSTAKQVIKKGSATASFNLAGIEPINGEDD